MHSNHNTTHLSHTPSFIHLFRPSLSRHCNHTTTDADFCAEVDRILDMVDGVCLVVDAAEGPMTQTKYVLSRALAMQLKPIVVLNKCDRTDALAQLDNGTTEASLQRLFEMLTSQQQSQSSQNSPNGRGENNNNNSHDYVTMYASARQGWVVEDDPFTAMELAEQPDAYDQEEYGMHKLLDVIVREIPEPSVRIYTSDDNNTETATHSSSGLSHHASFFANAHHNADNNNIATGGQQQPLSIAAVTVGYDPYLGRTCTGRIVSGSVQVGDAVVVLSRSANQQQQQQQSTSSSTTTSSSRSNSSDAASAAASTSLSSTVSGIFVYKGIHRIPFPESADGSGTIIASAGDCVTLAGVPLDMAVGDTLTSLKNPVLEPLSTPPLAPPTLAMDWSANQGPLAGQDGTQIASSKIQQRLKQETDNNVTLSIEPQQEKTVGTCCTLILVQLQSELSTVSLCLTHTYTPALCLSYFLNFSYALVLARGELQLGILIEQMRREGFEIVISPPRILTYEDEQTGQLFEPFEEVTVDVDAEYSGTVVSALTGDRKGILMEMINSGNGDKDKNSSSNNDGKSRLIFEVPSRGLLGFHSEIATLTKGSAVVNHVFLEDRPHVGSLHGMTKSKLVSSAQGKATAHALASLAARGTLFIEPGDMVYSGMVIGENAKTSSPDLEVNPVRAKEVTNMRTAGKEEKVHLPPAKKMSVEELIGYMNEDEMLEVTPHYIRLRKALLDASARERASRNKAKQLRSAK
jgi:GTP-binding protein